MDLYKNWLYENGVKFEEKDYGLSFKYQGGYFIIGNNENDPQYLNIIMPGIFDFADHPEIPREKILEAMNKINAQYKVAKCVCDDEDVWVTTEIFIDSTPDIEDFMERLLNILHQSRMEFFQYIRE